MTAKRTYRIVFFILFLFSLIATAQGQRKKVGLVLSGGGAKGAAHIGVLKVLEEAKIPVDYIAGTSMGAIIGGLYAVGYSAADLDSLVNSQDWTALLSDNIARQNMLFFDRALSDRYLLSIPFTKDHKIKFSSGIVGGQSVYNMLASLTIGYHDSISFAKLPIPFACVSYDVAKGKEEVMTSGNLPRAIRSSMSIPGAFTPVTQYGKVLIDGGISNNMPVDVVRRMGADVVIAVDLSSGMIKAENITSLMDIVDQLTTIMGEPSYAHNMEHIDLYLHPDVEPYNIASFNKEALDTLINRGEKVARERFGKIIALRNSLGSDSTEVISTRKHHNPLRDSVSIGHIRIEGLSPEDAKVVRKMIPLRDYSYEPIAKLNDIAENLRGTKLFDNVSFMVNSNHNNDLVYHLEEGSRSSINLGIRFDTEEMASILLNTTLSSKALRGSSVNLTTRLSKSPYVMIGYSFTTNTFLKSLSLSYMFKYNDNTLVLGDDKRSNLTYRQHFVDLNTGFSFSKFGIRIGSFYEYMDYNTILYSSGVTQFSVKPGGYLNYYVKAQFENLDNVYFPQKGGMLKTDFTVTTDNGATINGKIPFSAASLDFLKAASISNRITILPAVYARFLIGEDIPYPYMNFLGGSERSRYRNQQIPFIGIPYAEPFRKNTVVGRVDFRLRLWKNHYITLKENYAFSSSEITDILTEYSVWGTGVDYSYDSILGPIGVQVSRSSESNNWGVYFHLGRYF